jgi:hypothetical protein
MMAITTSERAVRKRTRARRDAEWVRAEAWYDLLFVCLLISINKHNHHVFHQKRWARVCDVWKRSFCYELQSACYRNYVARIESEIAKLTCGKNETIIYLVLFF